MSGIPLRIWQMAEEIRRAGGTVTYVEAENEGQGLDQPLNQLYVGALGLEFMERCLSRDRSLLKVIGEPPGSHARPSAIAEALG
jgi:hypothetical protein